MLAKKKSITEGNDEKSLGIDLATRRVCKLRGGRIENYNVGAAKDRAHEEAFYRCRARSSRSRVSLTCAYVSGFNCTDRVLNEAIASEREQRGGVGGRWRRREARGEGRRGIKKKTQ